MIYNTPTTSCQWDKTESKNSVLYTYAFYLICKNCHKYQAANCHNFLRFFLSFDLWVLSALIFLIALFLLQRKIWMIIKFKTCNRLDSTSRFTMSESYAISTKIVSGFNKRVETMWCWLIIKWEHVHCSFIIIFFIFLAFCLNYM